MYVDVHQVWDRCTSHTPVKPTPRVSDSRTTPWEDGGLVITQHQARKTSLGWINGKLWLLPWTSTGASTKDGWRLQVMCQWVWMFTGLHVFGGGMDVLACGCHWIADWMTAMTTHMELSHSSKTIGGMKWICTPLCQVSSMICHHLPWCRILLLNHRGTSATNTKGGFIPSPYQRKNHKYPQLYQTNETQAWGHALTQKQGEVTHREYPFPISTWTEIDSF